MTRRTTYHHGELKQALLDQALQSIEHQGASAITLRKLAQQLAVSHTACYRHFSSKNSLLAALMQQGFELLLDDLQLAANANPHRHILDKLQVLCASYLQFARRRSAYYQLMFSDLGQLRLMAAEKQIIQAARDRVWTYFLDCICQAQEIKFIRQGEAKRYAFYLWSTLHGACVLHAMFAIEGSAANCSHQAQQPWEQALLAQIYTGMAP